MDKLELFNKNDLKSLLKRRPREIKFGEHIHLLSDLTNIYDDLINLDVDYVIFGIKEDVGVFANYGKSRTSKAWDATLKVLLNIQSNRFTKANRVLILGYLNYSDTHKSLKSWDQNSKKDILKARKTVEKIDQDVSHLVHNIVKAGKTPIIIGGGHNNAYGNIKGTSLALKTPINAINFDAHTDFQSEEGRHNGNGFSYAFAEGFLKNYFIFGLHENYTSETIFKTLKKLKTIDYNTFEAIEIRNDLDYKGELKRALNFVNKAPFGIEIDCSAINNVPSNTKTPSGFTINTARSFVNYMAAHKKAKYIHICEATPTSKTEAKIGKLISYLITDFIRA